MAGNVRFSDTTEPSDTTINLVFASDRKYLPYTAVTLASILKNYRGDKAIRVFVMLDRKMPAQDVEKFRRLRELHDYTLEEIVVDASVFASVRTTDGISVATYYRLLMHRLLPPDIEKVLYLDSDLIISSSIDELFGTTFDGNLFAGVEDSTSRTYLAKFGIPHSGRHINAGVMLANLTLMRAISFEEHVYDYLNVNRYRITLGDQQIIGELYYDAIKYVPVTWNVHGPMFEPNWLETFGSARNGMNIDEARAAVESPAIVHYTLKRKPWMSLEHPKSLLWFDYLALTPYREDIVSPPLAPAIKPSEKAVRKFTFSRLIRTVAPGYLLSIWRLRQTRLKVMELSKIRPQPAAGPNLGGIPSGAKLKKTQPRKSDLDIKLKQILSDRASRAPETWTAIDGVSALKENSTILSNVSRKDCDGGYAENIKTIFRTPNIQYNFKNSSDAIILLSQRIDQGMFWDCLEEAYLYDKPLFFAEVAFFAGFASFFDKQADLNEKRAFGFILDDLGYYFDSRQPSRLEKTLNSPAFSLNESEKSRASRLISRINSGNFTKYNKYNSKNKFAAAAGSVLIIDQKRGDASIQFSGAKDDDFDKMIQAAANENYGRKIYFKRHPDTILGHSKQFEMPALSDVIILPDDISIMSVIDKADKIYTVSSQVGFEGLLRGKEVVTFGQPFYAGWGLTDDRNPPVRRTAKRTIEEIFYTACIQLSVYANPQTGKVIEMEEMLDLIEKIRRPVNLPVNR